MKIQERIQEIMRSKKMKQSLVAAAAGYSAKAFSDMLNGRKLIRPEDIIPICMALEVGPNDLFNAPEPTNKSAV